MRAEILNKKKFVIVAFRRENKAFVMNIVALTKPENLPVHFYHQAQVILLTSEEVKVSAECFEFSDVFSSNSATELLENTGINQNPNNMINNKQIIYDPINTLGLVKLEIFKIYNEINLVNNFIRLFKYLAGTSIAIVCMKANSFLLYVNY